MTFRVRGAKKFQAKYRDLQITVRDDLLKSALRKSFEFGQRIIPKHTRALYKGFQLIDRKKTGTIRQLMPSQSRPNPRPYHLWMYGTGNPTYNNLDGSTGTINIGKFQSRIRRGKYDYMKRVGKDIPKQVKKILRDKLKQK